MRPVQSERLGGAGRSAAVAGRMPRGDSGADSVAGRIAVPSDAAARAHQARFQHLVQAPVVGRSGPRQPGATPRQRAQARRPAGT